MGKTIGVILTIPLLLFLTANLFLQFFEFYKSFGLISLSLAIGSALLILGSFTVGVCLIIKDLKNNEENI